MLVLLSDALDSVWLLITQPLRRMLADAFYEALTRAREDDRLSGEVHWGPAEDMQPDVPLVLPPAWTETDADITPEV